MTLITARAKESGVFDAKGRLVATPRCNFRRAFRRLAFLIGMSFISSRELEINLLLDRGAAASNL
jgi:hypothetical protein